MRDICLSFVCLQDIRVYGFLLLYVFYLSCASELFSSNGALLVSGCAHLLNWFCFLRCLQNALGLNGLSFSYFFQKRMFQFFNGRGIGSSVLQIYSNFSGKNKNRKQRVSCSCSKFFNQKIGKACFLILQFCSVTRRTFFDSLQLFIE